MLRITRHLLPVLISVIAILALPAKSQAKVLLTFGVYTSDKPSAMVQQLRPTLNFVEQSIAADLGEPVEIKLEVVRG